ncbi:MAG TPA: hypothetical protein VHP11_15325, partial [Tepidisphaeraceae bacterium]|nr:hypothetical protein [Tepidisphaeraceae bacterium]
QDSRISSAAKARQGNGVNRMLGFLRAFAPPCLPSTFCLTFPGHMLALPPARVGDPVASQAMSWLFEN